MLGYLFLKMRAGRTELAFAYLQKFVCPVFFSKSLSSVV